MRCRLLHLSDIHFGAENTRALEAVENSVISDDIDCVAVSGDLTQKGKRSEFARAAAWLAKLNKPFISVPGNHDTPMLNLGARATAPFKRFYALFGDRATAMSAPPLHAVGLNTARGWQFRRNWAEGHVGIEKLMLAIRSAKTSPSMYRALVCHHPLLPPTNSPIPVRTRHAKVAHRLIAESPVSVVLSGHVHVSSAKMHQTEIGRYISISAGTLSTRTRDDHPPSFNVIDFAESGVSAFSHSVVNDNIRQRELGSWTYREIFARTASSLSA